MADEMSDAVMRYLRLLATNNLSDQQKRYFAWLWTPARERFPRTVADLAAELGVGRQTLWRWSKLPEFQQPESLFSKAMPTNALAVESRETEIPVQGDEIKQFARRHGLPMDRVKGHSYGSVKGEICVYWGIEVPQYFHICTPIDAFNRLIDAVRLRRRLDDLETISEPEAQGIIADSYGLPPTTSSFRPTWFWHVMTLINRKLCDPEIVGQLTEADFLHLGETGEWPEWLFQ